MADTVDECVVQQLKEFDGKKKAIDLGQFGEELVDDLKEMAYQETIAQKDNEELSDALDYYFHPALHLPPRCQCHRHPLRPRDSRKDWLL